MKIALLVLAIALAAVAVTVYLEQHSFPFVHGGAK
jgi:hypothetical protein